MTDLGALILSIFTHLKTALGQVQRPDRAYNERLLMVYNRWHRSMRRLITLWERWKSNTLPKKRPSQAGKPRKRAPRPEGYKPYPGGCLWLCHNNWQVNNAGEGLRHHLESPEFQEFLKAVPQAGRLIRPILKQLHIAPTPVLALPPRPRKPRPKKPRFKRDPKPPRVFGGVVARNAVRDIAGNIKATLATVKQTDYRDSG